MYYVIADEVASTGTHHTHIYIYSKSPIRFSTLKNRLPTAHIEKAYGTSQQNRDYILKTVKEYTEYGQLPTEKSENAPEMQQLIEAIQNGKRPAEIIEESPQFAFRIRELQTLSEVMNAHFATNDRELTATYIFGANTIDITRYIFKHHEAKEICRITNYRASRDISFDNYNSQKVIIFEDFESQISIRDMCHYLNPLPIYLPARYNDRFAAYNHVYITSTLPLMEQYKEIQLKSYEIWNTFIRSINHVIEYNPDGTTEEIFL